MRNSHHPLLSRGDRILHEGVARFEMLGAADFFRLPLHLFHLPPLRQCLRAGIDEGDGREQRASYSC